MAHCKDCSIVSKRQEAVSYRVLYGSNRAINLKEIVPQRKIQRDAGEKTELSNVFKKICLGENEDIANAIEVYMQHNFLDLKSLEKYHVAVMELIGELYHFMVNNEMDPQKYREASVLCIMNCAI